MKPTLLVVAVASCVATLSAQQGGPPPVLQITREAIKEGKGAAHRKVEADYANMFRKAKYSVNYIALNSSSGPEVWFVSALPSFAAIEQSDKEEDKEPLKSALALVEARDGELRTSSHTITAVLRPDLSYMPQDAVPLPKIRYAMVETFRVRLGRDEDFAAGGKMITGAMAKAKFKTAGYMYQVVAGAPEGTYMVFAPMASLKELDEQPAREKAMIEAMGADNYSRMMKGTGDVIQSIEATIFSVSPEMSYPGKDIEDADPAFWKPKAAAAAKPAEQKGQ